MIRRLLIFCLFPLIASAQSLLTIPDTLFLRTVVPGRQDTLRLNSSRHRIAGCTHPSAKAYINSKEVKVYSSGAFIGMFQIPVDTSRLRISVVAPNGDSLWKEYVVIRPQPVRSSPAEGTVIEPAMMEPSENLWLTAGDFLEVRIKGTPGLDASFSIDGVESGLPMRELPAAEINGVAGIYVGRYKVRSGDASGGEPVKFKLKRSFLSWETAYSKAKVWIINDSLPRVAEATGRRPFLNVGLGSDRLGGAKLGFLQPGVRLEITGKVGSQYRVHLSEGLDAWIPEEYVKFLAPELPLPRSLTGSISVVGTDSFDVVNVSLSQKLPYTSEQQVNPTAIVIDVHGATSNTNWITHHRSAKGIESVKWTQVAGDRYRLIISLRHTFHWGYDIDYTGSSLRVRVKRPPIVSGAEMPLKGLTIGVDAGHGGENRGALGATGVQEANVNLALAKALESALKERGAAVIMTRTNDDGPLMSDRADKVLGGGANILVSIHCNSTGEVSDPLSVSGVSTYYRYAGFKPLADLMYDKMLSLGLNQWGVTGSFNFSLNGPTQLPNVLIETAFMSHPEDEILLLDDSFHKRMGEVVARGVEEFVLQYGTLEKK